MIAVKLARLTFDDNVLVALGKDTGGGVRQDLRDSAFDVVAGWELTWYPESEQFGIWRQGMPEPSYIGGYGYSYVLAQEPAKLELVKKGKR